MRTLVDIPDDDIQWLDRKAAEEGKSRTALVREAVEAYRDARSGDWIDRGFGLWKHRTDIGDAVEWQRRERAGSTRPWDADYEEVKAEFPDLFDAEDDRQRQIYLKMAGGQSLGGRRRAGK